MSGTLFVVSAVSSDGTDLRPGRYTDLGSLVQAESSEAEALNARVRRLNDEITALSDGLGDRDVDRYRERAASLQDPAGLTEHDGAGITVTLSDAPEEVRRTSPYDPNIHVVHQQDLQALVNALWAGGAEAVTLQGQRLISTSGIKCEGNAVLIQGIPYPQPYVVSAIGDTAELLAAVDSDDDVSTYRDQADDPTIAIGWSLEFDGELTAPAYGGLLDLDYAQPIADQPS